VHGQHSPPDAARLEVCLGQPADGTDERNAFLLPPVCKWRRGCNDRRGSNVPNGNNGDRDRSRPSQMGLICATSNTPRYRYRSMLLPIILWSSWFSLHTKGKRKEEHQALPLRPVPLGARRGADRVVNKSSVLLDKPPSDFPVA
jgi:hypothetical protein